MLIQGSIEIQDLNVGQQQRKGRPLRSCLMSKNVNGNYYLCLKNSMYPNSIDYKMTDLDQVHSKFVKEGKLSMRFKQPRHLLLLQADDKKMLLVFLRQIQDIVSGKKVNIGTRQMPKSVPAKKDVNRFDPSALEFIAIKQFDRRLLNMRHLSRLVLENCNLPSLPAQIGHLPIKYLSLMSSKLAKTQYDRDTFWDWMTIDTIGDTLSTLKMDSLGLKILPFEMMYLQNLQHLSLTKNELTYLPHYFGDLKKLQFLYVADNLLHYLPVNLYYIGFKELDISNNLFMKEDLQSFDHINNYMKLQNECDKLALDAPCVQKLCHFSFYTLVQNNIKFKRQDIPRTLWPYFNVFGRCAQCRCCMLPEYVVVQHHHAMPKTLSLIRDHNLIRVPWQSLVCRFKCE